MLPSELSSASEFDPCQASAPEVLIGEGPWCIIVGRDDPKFGIFNGFHEISVLAPVMGLSFRGIIINAQVTFLNA